MRSLQIGHGECIGLRKLCMDFKKHFALKPILSFHFPTDFLKCPCVKVSNTVFGPCSWSLSMTSLPRCSSTLHLDMHRVSEPPDQSISTLPSHICLKDSPSLCQEEGELRRLKNTSGGACALPGTPDAPATHLLLPYPPFLPLSAPPHSGVQPDHTLLSCRQAWQLVPHVGLCSDCSRQVRETAKSFFYHPGPRASHLVIRSSGKGCFPWCTCVSCSACKEQVQQKQPGLGGQTSPRSRPDAAMVPLVSLRLLSTPHPPVPRVLQVGHSTCLRGG